MLWRFEDSELQGFAEGMPDLAGTAVVMARVGDHRSELFASETAELERMAEIRQFGFSSGRYCAHLAQSMLNLTVEAVGREERVPIWPEHSVGSITHSDRIAGAIASTAHRSIGIDIEESDRVDEKLFRILFTDAEKERISKLDFDAATVMFSAKEAGYKAIYPIGQKFVGFQEAEIYLQPEECRFTIEYIGEHAPNNALNGGAGYWRELDGHVLTVFAIPFE